MKKKTRFNELKRVFNTLHGKKGCIWDKEQTHESLIPYLKEEAIEFIETVEENTYEHMKEELGDILLQVMFHAQIAKKNNKFDIEDVMEILIKKLKRRHPHVFSGLKVSSSKEIISNWKTIKRKEKIDKRKKR
ncbi:MAG: MazG nucleotide pyrophosphohydrolase domain-containing protein [Candidatus Gygaella obscura]|nr:MazG nucleotide pyrophosphohydrolase domain-containing protein [Candidatus Gygaella obscura]